MPVDGVTNGTNAKLKNKTWVKQKSTTESEMQKISQDSMLPEPLRQKLQLLFSQIEKEFETLYAENLALQERLEFQSAQGGQGNTDRADAIDQLDGFSQKSSKKSGIQISQKIKSTYKTSTSKIANTFKNTSQNGAAQFVKTYNGHTDGVWEVSVSRYGASRVIGTASADYTAKIWCIETGKILLQYYGHKGSVNSIRFHPQSDLVLTASGDQGVHIWKVAIPAVYTDNNTKLSSSEDDTDGDDGTVERNGDISNPSHFIHAPIRCLSEHRGVVVAADWLANSSHVISGSWDGTAVICDAEKGLKIDTLLGHENELTNVVGHPTHMLALTSSKDCSIRLWDMRGSGKQVNCLLGHLASVTSAVFADSERIISGSDDRTVKFWDMRNMSSPYVTIRTDSGVNRLSVSPVSGLIAVPHDNRHIRIYDVNGNRLTRLPRSNRIGHSKMVCSTAWNDDGNNSCNLFSAGFERHVLGWNVNFRGSDISKKQLSH